MVRCSSTGKSKRKSSAKYRSFRLAIRSRMTVHSAPTGCDHPFRKRRESALESGIECRRRPSPFFSVVDQHDQPVPLFNALKTYRGALFPWKFGDRFAHPYRLNRGTSNVDSSRVHTRRLTRLQISRSSDERRYIRALTHLGAYRVAKNRGRGVCL